MKLDSIVYDYNSLTNTIAEALNSESASFRAIYPSDTATSLVNVLGSYGAMLQYQLVSALANCYTDSAYSEAGIRQLAETLGNRLHGNISSHIYCNITRTTLTGLSNVVIPTGSVFTVAGVTFFNPEPIIFTTQTNTVENVKLIQGTLLTSIQYSSGISGEKIYFCDDFKCNTDLVHVYINDEEWVISDSFLPYVVTDTSIAAEAQAVVLRTDSNGRTYIKFGNNSNGIVPSAGSTIRIEYVSNEGVSGNLSGVNLDITLDTPLYFTNNGISEPLEVDIYAISTASGGFNTQSLSVLRESSPYVFGSGQRAVRRNDYKSMLLNKCGYLTCNVWGEYEEARLYGGYDKIMMNMVYYSGIKSIQKYSYQPLKTLYINVPQLEIVENNLYNFTNNLTGARGFGGSYIIELTSYTSDNQLETIQYRDRSGTGILTCDPSINSQFVKDEDVDNKNVLTIFPLNDLDTAYAQQEFNISTNQQYEEGISPINANPEILVTGGTSETGDYLSTGKDINGQPKIINFDNPFQIRFNFAARETIAAFAFQAPHDETKLGKFMNQFAIFATNETDPSYDNIKNNTVTWTRVSELQTFDHNLATDEWSDWITTNVYQPNTALTETEDLTNNREIISHDPDEYSPNIFIIDNLVGDDYTYKVQLGTEIQLTNTYVIEGNRLIFNHPVEEGTTVILYATSSTWLRYKNYVIEIYTLKDAAVTSPKYICLQKIKALFKDTVSTIDYSNNNYVNMNIPILDTENIISTYTRDGEQPMTEHWLSLAPGDAALEPSYDAVYTITDISTRENIIELTDSDNGGHDYEVGDTLTITAADAGTYENVIGFRLRVDAVRTDGVNTGIISQCSLLNDYVTSYVNCTTGAITATLDNQAHSGTGATFHITSTLTGAYTGTKVRWYPLAEPPRYEPTGVNTKRLALPEELQYYEYSLNYNNITETAGYRTGEVLTYETIIDNFKYHFDITIKNIATQEFKVKLAIDNDYPSEVLRGKSNLNLENVEIIGGSGSGGTITVSSTSTLKATGSYIGNFYSNVDIQAADLPTINKYNHFTTYIEFKQPRIKNVKLNVVLEYENVSNYQTVKKNVITAINNVFEITPDYLGKSLDVSKIWKAINSVDGIKRFLVVDPISNIDCMPYELIMLPEENLIIQDILNDEVKDE